MGKKPQSKRFVVLRVYKGTKLSYNEKGDIENTNQTIKIEYDTREWKSIVNTLALTGYARVDVEKVFYLDDDRTECKDFSDIEKEVQQGLKPVVKRQLTPEQIEIAELKAKLESFISGGSKKETIEDDSDDKPKTIEDIRKEYEEVVGKKPHHMAKIETLVKEIEENK